MKRKGRPALPADRLWSHYAEDAGGCWIFTGSRCAKGYGLFTLNGRTVRAHRVAYDLSQPQPLAAGQIVLHTCDTRACIRPDHLKAGTVRQNNADRAAKGRSAAPTGRKLTEAAVLDIRASLANRTRSRKSLARQYGVSATLVRMVERRQVWARVAPSVEELRNGDALEPTIVPVKNDNDDYEHALREYDEAGNCSDKDWKLYSTLFAGMLDCLGLDYGYGVREPGARIPAGDAEGRFSEDAKCVVRPYHWGNNKKITALPNFIYKPRDLYVGWYKYPLRSATASQPWDLRAWAALTADVALTYVNADEFMRRVLQFIGQDDIARARIKKLAGG